MSDPFISAPTRATPGSLLDGVPGRRGFVFHDAHNQPVHQAAPGILGLLEARLVIGRWNPRSLAWLDGTEHFFNHLRAEFEGFAPFDPIGQELGVLGRVEAPWPARNAFLFQYLGALSRELERAGLAPARGGAGPSAVDGDTSLNGRWTVRHRSGEEWAQREIGVPGNWELTPGVDDYAGTMRFTRTFPTPVDAGRGPVVLRFAGVDYFADVWVNGFHLGGHEGYFEPFEFDVSPHLRTDRALNVLRVAVTAPNEPSGPGTHVTSGWHDFSPTSAFPNRKTLVKGTLGHHDAKRGGAWSSVTGQDGNTGGIWDNVSLSVRNPVHLSPAGVRVTTLTVTPDGRSAASRVAARTDLHVRNTTATNVQARIRLQVEPANFEGDAHELVKLVDLAPGENAVSIAGTLSAVRLWNPVDHGFPHLYRVTTLVEVDGEVADTRTVETGFRTLAVSPIGESTGPDGAFVVNGRPVFVRGTNLLPTYWLSEYSPERVDRDFALLRAGGFNGVLIHNLVAPRHFYERANREGFLVVQMFPLQWTYDQSHEVVQSMTAQIRAMAGHFVNDPSVVSYETHNEPDMRTSEDLDNRFVDFDLHAVLREADPTRWATTFSSGNHAYPGQFYPLRDDNGFATLPARFLEEEFAGRRISRHCNMPTEFGIQAMPNLELFRELVAEGRVRSVLERIRTDPRWVAAGAGSWADATKTIDEAKHVLGRGSWPRALKALDWRLLWDVGDLGERIRRAELAPVATAGAESELVSLRLAVLLLDVLHYGGFKGENFWFGLWKPAATLEGFVASGQNRQYRLHKDAIEHYLNAGAVGPIVGYFSFMFRDADWEAPTWGVVDAAWTPKKAFRAYLESNAAVRVTLPDTLRSPVKLPGDPWTGVEMIVANDTLEPVTAATVSVWLEDAGGEPLELDLRHSVDIPAGAGVTRAIEGTGGVVADDLPAGTYFLRARVSSPDGQALSTNGYELVVLDTTFPWLAGLSNPALTELLDGAPGVEGFHYWHGGAVAHRAQAGLRGLLAGWSQVETRGIDLYETVQGEHLFRHLLPELEALAGARSLGDDIWTIRSEIVSPEVKSRTLLRYVGLVVRRAETLLATKGPRPSGRLRRSATASDTAPPASLFPAVGRDVHSRPGRNP